MRRTVVRLGWRDLREHPGRALLAVVGIALGTAVVLASLASRAATANAVEAALAAEIGDADVIAVPIGAESGLVPDGAVADLAARPGVERALGNLRTAANLRGPQGTLPNVALTTASDPRELLEGAPRREGHDDVLLTRSAARSLGAEPGDTVHVDARRPLDLTVAGIVSDETAGLAGNGRSATVSLATARALRDGATGWSSIRIALAPGADADRWVREQAPRAPDGVLLATASETVGDLETISRTVASGIDLLAITTVFIGGLLCFYVNQVAAIADRRRTALLLVVGATRRDVRQLVLVRSLAVGVVGAVVGCAFGIVLAAAVTPLVVRLLGFTARTTMPPGPAFAVAAVCALAMSVSALASLPTRGVGPIDALRTSEHVAGGRRPRPWLALSLAAGFFALALGAHLPGPGPVLAGLGLLVTTAWAVRDLLRWAADRAGRRDRDDAPSWGRAHPVRTLAWRSLGRDARASGTAMGLLMAAFAVLLATASAHRALEVTIDRALAAQLGSDLQIAFRGSTPPPSPEDVLSIPGVTSQSRLSFGLTTARRDGVDRPLPLTALDPSTYFDVASLDWRRGDPAQAQAALRAGGATLLTEPIAHQLGVDVGDTISVRTTTGTTDLRVAGTFVSFLGSAAIVSTTDARERFGLDDARLVLLGIAPEHAVVAEQALRARWPDARVVVVRDYRAAARTNLLSLFGVGYSTLLVAVALGACGLAASLSGSVLRREPELRLLRSIGATRRDASRLIVLEAVAIVAVGGALSLPIGLALSRVTLDVFERAMGADLGIATPVGVLVTIPLVVLPLALVSSVAPARRASRTTLT